MRQGRLGNGEIAVGLCGDACWTVGLCGDASSEVIAFDACVSAATGRMKRLPLRRPAWGDYGQQIDGRSGQRDWKVLWCRSLGSRSADHHFISKWRPGCIRLRWPVSLPPQDTVPKSQSVSRFSWFFFFYTLQTRLTKSTSDAPRTLVTVSPPKAAKALHEHVTTW